MQFLKQFIKMKKMTFLNGHSNDHYVFYLFLRFIGEIPKKSSAFSLFSMYNKVKIS
jgi:hypothetical protein